MLSSDLSFPMQAILGVQLGLRFCTKCRAFKSSAEFHSCLKGKHTRCKVCRSEQMKDHYLENIDRRRESNRAYMRRIRSENPAESRRKSTLAARAYRVRDPEKARARARKYYRTCPDTFRARDVRYKYSITMQEREEIIRSQNGVCRACKLPPATGNVLQIDRSHRSGKVRGMLCRGCNLAFGLVKENPVALRGLIAYEEFFREN